MEDLLPELGFMNLFEKVAVIRYMNIYKLSLLVYLLEEGHTDQFYVYYDLLHLKFLT